MQVLFLSADCEDEGVVAALAWESGGGAYDRLAHIEVTSPLRAEGFHHTVPRGLDDYFDADDTEDEEDLEDDMDNPGNWEGSWEEWDVT